MTLPRHWPAIALLILTVLRLGVAWGAPLSPDEAYYWVWSRALAPGYLDHPPMVALWMRAGTLLAGDTTFGIRLLAPLAAALGTWLLADAAEALLPNRRAGLLAGLLLNATLVLGAGAVILTPDTPQLLFWTATLWALARWLRDGRDAWWLAAGAALGLAMASKYTGILLAPAIGGWLVVTPTLRRTLLRPLPWLGGLLAALVFCPVVAWNATHGWASFSKQGGRTGDWHPTLRFLGELLGSQAGLATPLVFLLCAAGAWAAARRWRSPAWGLLAWVTLLPLAVFVQHALGDRVQGNWPSVLYPSAAIAAAGLIAEQATLCGWTARLLRPAVGLGFAITALVYLQVALAILPLPATLDPTLRLLGGWPGLAAEVAQAARSQGAAFVAADNYAEAALLARDLPADIPVLGAEPRWVFFDLPSGAPAMAGRTGLLLRDARRRDAPAAAPWASVIAVGQVTRSRAGLVGGTYTLYRVVGRADAPSATALLPRP